MTELETLKAEYAALGARLEKLEAAEKPWPQKGDDFWYVGAGGYIGEMSGDPSWSEDKFDLGAQAIGNVFRTEQEAIDERDRRKVLTIMREMADGGDCALRLWNGCIAIHELRHIAMEIGACRFTPDRAQACLDRIVEMLSENGTRDGMARLLELWVAK